MHIALGATFRPFAKPAHCLGALALFILAAPVSAATFYVAPSGSNGNPGTQAAPVLTIQQGINKAAGGDTVVVADGTYSGSGNRDIDFNGKNLTLLSANGDPNRTVIDCGGSNTASHRGFYIHRGETAVSISGVTIRSGFVSGSGGGVEDVGSTATLQNCVLLNNIANMDGGGLHNSGGGAVTLTDCVFRSNHSLTTNSGGGGLANETGSTATLTNCLFSSNTGDKGGAFSNHDTVSLTNCTFSANQSNSQGGGLYNDTGANMTLTNDLFWGDAAPTEIANHGLFQVTKCDIQGGLSGADTFNADPLYVNAPADLHLQFDSPCLGAGTPVSVPAADLDGYPRPNPPSIGAYERHPGHTHVLWQNSSSGQTGLWAVGADGSVIGHGYGPYAGWTAAFLADGPDGLAHLLWTNPNGSIALWSVAADGTFTGLTYGPFPGWSPLGLTVGPDNHVHVIWNHPADQQMALWDVDTRGTPTSVAYGPFSGYTASKLTVSLDNHIHVLWNTASGSIALWDLPPAGTLLALPILPAPVGARRPLPPARTTMFMSCGTTPRTTRWRCGTWIRAVTLPASPTAPTQATTPVG